MCNSSPLYVCRRITPLLFFAFSSILIIFVDAQDACPFKVNIDQEHQGFPPDCPPSWISKKITPISSKTTMAQKISTDRKVHPALEVISSELIELRRRRSLAQSPCMVGIEDLFSMAKTARTKKLTFGFGCSTECPVIAGDFEPKWEIINTAEGATNVTTFNPSPERSERLFKAISAFEGKLKEYGTQVFAGYGFNWPNLYSMNFYQYVEPDGMRSCNVSDILAYHINGRFSMAASLTNESIYKSVPEGQRFGLTEFLTFSNDSSGDMYTNPRPIRMKSCTEKPWRSLPPKNGTAVMEVYGGRTDTNHFKTTKIEDNPAVATALERGNAQKELVRDAKVLSNAAILIVPAALTFVPLSLFQEVAAGMALMYAILTDVVTVVPLGIKGMELIHLGSQVTWATQAHVYGMESATEDGTIELWVARCVMDRTFRNTGIIFLVLAITLMFLGLFLEVFFAYLLQRQKKAWDEADRVLPRRHRNAGVFWYWKNSFRHGAV